MEVTFKRETLFGEQMPIPVAIGHSRIFELGNHQRKTVDVDSNKAITVGVGKLRQQTFFLDDDVTEVIIQSSINNRLWLLFSLIVIAGTCLLAKVFLPWYVILFSVFLEVLLFLHLKADQYQIICVRQGHLILQEEV